MKNDINFTTSGNPETSERNLSQYFHLTEFSLRLKREEKWAGIAEISTVTFYGLTGVRFTAEARNFSSPSRPNWH
jgi:hypothetical protein